MLNSNLSLYKNYANFIQLDFFSNSLVHEKLSILLILSVCLFFISIFGISVNRRNVLILMLCIEILLLSSVLNFIILSSLLLDPLGQVYALMVITLAACESAIGLGLLISAYRLKKKITISSLSNLRG